VRVTINGEEREVPEVVTVEQLVLHLGLAGGLVAVEQNCAVVPRAEHASRLVRAGDAIEIVHFVGGG
jgi:sulfur carrier protein